MFFGADDGILYCLQPQQINKKPFKRYVYWDKAKGSLMFRNSVDVLIKDFLSRKGYSVIDESKLASIVEENKNTGSGNIIVLISSHLPKAFVRTDSINILRSFIESGGVIADAGNNPLVYNLDSSGNFNGFDFKRCANIIDIHYPENDLRSFGGIFTATATKEGKAMGIKEQWTATCPVDKKDVDVILGVDEKGRASSWIKNIGKGKFVVLWIEQTFPEDYNFVDNVLTNVERM